MSEPKELEKRVEHLETEVGLLKELIKLQDKTPERVIPTYPQKSTNPWYREPTLEPPYKITCEGGEE